MATSRWSMVLLLLAVAALTRGDAQLVAPSPADATCAKAVKDLAPCVAFITGAQGEPSPTCCNDLKDVAQNEPSCICELFNNPAQYQDNLTLALELPQKCRLAISQNICLSPNAGPPVASTPVPVPVTVPLPSAPPAVPPGPPPPTLPETQTSSPNAASCVKTMPFGILAILATVQLQ